MARCPVCKTECGESTRCSSCGFDDIRSEFLNQEEYDFWVKNIVKAYKPIHEIDYSDFKINGPVLYCARLDAYVGNSSEVIIPSGITRIAKGAFANNKKITRVVLSADIREIGDNAFENCENLIEICLPEKLKKIGEYAFLNCKSLKEIEFLSMTNSIGVCHWHL